MDRETESKNKSIVNRIKRRVISFTLALEKGRGVAAFELGHH
jgi:hypothetical protein